MRAFPVSPAVVGILAELVEERTGLHYNAEDRQSLLIPKISDRVTEAGFDSLLDYYYFLRYDPAAGEEFSRLIDALVVGETYLFREFDQLQVIVSHCLQPLVRQGLRPKLWSAACASGEEPFTLAMLMAEAGLLGRVDLVASDISERALERARTGLLGRRGLRAIGGVPSDLWQCWLTEKADGFRVAPELLAAIDWRRINLTDARAVSGVGTCDVVVCRNVLIYFSDETTAKVVANLSSVLAARGSLFVGVSESLMRFSTSLVCEQKERTFCYRKGF